MEDPLKDEKSIPGRIRDVADLVDKIPAGLRALANRFGTFEWLIRSLDKRLKAVEDRELAVALGEEDGPWWVHAGWTPWGDPVRWSEPSGPFMHRTLAEARASRVKGHVVRITDSETPPVLKRKAEA